EADCFTTVSAITARECAALLGKAPDVVTPPGFVDGFVLPKAQARQMRARARQKLLSVAEALLGYALPQDTLLVATAGRYEFRNKGLDLFVASLQRLSQLAGEEDRPVLAYILVPGNVSAPRQEVLDRLAARQDGQTSWDGPVYHPYNTHWMYEIEHDQVLNAIKAQGLGNSRDEKVKVIFVPCYLHGHDGIFDMNYYDLLQGFDLTAFLSYYEPWGYTPLESIAFSIPTMTTSLSGFGSWYLGLGHEGEDLSGGVAVIDRCDGNESHVVETAARLMLQSARYTAEERETVNMNARGVSRQALWTRFIKYYAQAYRLALKNAAARNA
ncbi:MAG: glycosyl transferase, partial [Bacteroidales bacterium]|nr:glycosyl transferase [Bacteroidales bacterium]